MLEKENNECHCTENCGCKSHDQVHNKTASCGCDDQNKLDKMMEYDGSCNCGCECECTDESCDCGCDEKLSSCNSEELCGCDEHSCGCDEEHHEHK